MLNFQEKQLPRPSMNIYHKITTDAIMKVHQYLLNKFQEKVDLEFDETDYSKSLEEVLSLRELRRMEEIWIDVWGTLFKEHNEGREYEFPKRDENSQGTKRKLSDTFDEDDDVFEEEDKNPTKLPKLSAATDPTVSNDKTPSVLPESKSDCDMETDSESENIEVRKRTSS